MNATVLAPAGQKLTEQELQQARLFLKQTQDAATGATKGLSEAQWRFKPSPDRWSIAENLEHIVTVIERVFGPILEQVASAPPPPADYDSARVDAIVMQQFPLRLAKFNAPEFILPRGEVAPSEALARLAAGYTRLENLLESATWLRGHANEGLPLKAVTNGAYTLMDGYQWILAAAAHTERHTKQMLEVMADPGYPA